MQTGTVKWFNPAKGFGFIAPDQGGPDVFVHVSAVEKAGMRSLNEGQKIGFELQNDPKKGKSSAVNLQKAGAAAPKASEAEEAEDDQDEDESEDGQDEDEESEDKQAANG
jgi:CspA family cold shock protein